MLAALFHALFSPHLDENSRNTYACTCKTYARLRTSYGSIWNYFYWVSQSSTGPKCVDTDAVHGPRASQPVPLTVTLPETHSWRGVGRKTQWHGWNSSRSRVAVLERPTSLAACSPSPLPKACSTSLARTAVSSTALYRFVPLHLCPDLPYVWENEISGCLNEQMNSCWTNLWMMAGRWVYM